MKSIFAIFMIVIASSSFASGVFAAEATPAVSGAPSDFENRRAVLMKVLELSKSEIVDLRARLSETKRPTDAEFAIVYDALSDDLADNLALIESRMKELDSDYITLDAVRVMADNFKKWREAIYDPSTQELFSFLILQQGSSILSIVEARYEKVANDVESLKVVVAPEKADAFEAMLAEARTRVESAKHLRDAARQLFLASFAFRHPDLVVKLESVASRQVLLANITEVIDLELVEKPKTILDSLDMTKETVQTLMRRAVDEIAQTYKVFLQMRDLVYQK